ncbi:hypothetical protein BGZ80_001410 [Entomortierella chlamydospora]|uniref:Post-SET domain-containing protein n=1 Tax=Entomortierella chlamydospora TaxID=101097 RepID=A0A9P6SXR8_9FUNG|nr:hypothetical protein BGZ79_006516 [Entomortierella chlamydospora]KAG0010522.1 hypothetical protein BGZ80_001410 [Entomortierella chlamydospora]
MPTTYGKEETIADAEAAKAAYKPTHPGLFEIVYAEGSFNSQLVASKDFKKDEVICRIEGTVPGPKKYTTVQVSKDSHVELNSDRDQLTFFYPSSEWEMEQPFPCWCGAEKCCKSIQGAKFLPRDVMGKYFVTSHIRELLKERDAAEDLE